MARKPLQEEHYLGIEPSDNTRFDVIFNYEKNEPPPTGFTSQVFRSAGTFPSIFADAFLDKGEDLVNERTIWNATLRGTHNFSDNVGITSITGYRSYDGFEDVDTDGTIADAIFFNNDSDGTQFSQELRLNLSSNDGKFAGFVGGSYFKEDAMKKVPFETNEQLLFNLYIPFIHEQVDMDPNVTPAQRELIKTAVIPLTPLLDANGMPNIVYTSIPNFPQLFGPLAGAPLKTFHEEGYERGAENTAVEAFADGTFELIGGLSLTAGLRYTKEEISTTYFVDQFQPGNLFFLTNAFAKRSVSANRWCIVTLRGFLFYCWPRNFEL